MDYSPIECCFSNEISNRDLLHKKTGYVEVWIPIIIIMRVSDFLELLDMFFHSRDSLTLP
jgi:hypothetical protein